MSQRPRDTPICVTGATGFVASHVIRELLERGHTVRGTVRSVNKPEKTRHLRELPGADERLELVEADLTTAGSFDGAVTGCRYVIHAASPYVLDVQDPQTDLVDPALEGTREVLGACARAGSVQRVVLTSSMAAVTDEPDGDHALTEDDWNERSSLERNPYYYSKTLAEREAWRLVREEHTGLDLVVLNPFLVIGPSLNPGLNTSNRFFVDLLEGTFPGLINVSWGFVDVRDVARAHVLAMETPRARGRYICAARTVSMEEVVGLLQDAGYTGGKLPSLDLQCKLGDYVVTLASYFQPRGTGSYLRTHIGREPRFDNSKIQRELGLAFRPVEDTIRETVADLIRWGHVPAAVAETAPTPA